MSDDRRAAALSKALKSLGALSAEVDQPVLVLLVGLPGSGKSYLARAIAAARPAVVVVTDALRKTFFPKPTYSPAENGFLFPLVHRVVEQLLRTRHNVICDATNLAEDHRRSFYEISDKLGLRLLIILVQVDEAEAQRRLEMRRRGEDPLDRSDAGVAVRQYFGEKLEPIKRPHRVVDTSRDLGPQLQEILAQMPQAEELEGAQGR